MQKKDMEYEIELTEEAIRDLDRACEYVADILRNRKASERMYDKVIEVIGSLKQFPKRGSVLFDYFELSYRFVVADNYMIIYNIQETTVHVIRILYKRRDIKETLLEEL